jgi:segregation and condensation protein A
VNPSPPVVCRVSLDVFDGPLDLLLNLVKEQRLDITTVPLATVAEQYLRYIEMMDSLDVEVAAEYLVVAATLVFLKSRSLLPAIPEAFANPDEESPEAVEERLRRRLINYSRYRTAGEDLRRLSAEAASYFYREGGDGATELVQRYKLAANALAAAYVAALRSAKPEKATLARERVSLVTQMQYVVRVINTAGATDFATLCRDLTRPLVIATFLAVLELIRQERIGFSQEDLAGGLRLFPAAAVALSVN